MPTGPVPEGRWMNGAGVKPRPPLPPRPDCLSFLPPPRPPPPVLPPPPVGFTACLLASIAGDIVTGAGRFGAFAPALVCPAEATGLFPTAAGTAVPKGPFPAPAPAADGTGPFAGTTVTGDFALPLPGGMSLSTGFPAASTGFEASGAAPAALTATAALVAVEAGDEMDDFTAAKSGPLWDNLALHWAA